VLGRLHERSDCPIGPLQPFVLPERAHSHGAKVGALALHA
jgi:hypothetical protein